MRCISERNKVGYTLLYEATVLKYNLHWKWCLYSDFGVCVILETRNTKGRHTRGDRSQGPVAGTGRRDWSPVEFTRWNESRGSVPRRVHTLGPVSQQDSSIYDVFNI